MKENFSKLFRKYCMNSTIVGLKYLFIYPDVVSRCFWVTSMVANLVASLIMGWLLYSRFNEMPTRVTIENQYEPVSNLPYPAITICTPNQMTMSSVRYFNKTLIDGNITINLEKVMPMILGFYELIEDFDIPGLKHLEKLMEDNRYTTLEVLGTIPQSCDRFLKRCMFEGSIWDCGELLKPILTTHGLCCAFNSLYTFDGLRNIVDPHFLNLTVKGYGLQNSLTVVMDYDPDDSVPATLLGAGDIRVMYTDWSEFPSDDETRLVNPHGEVYHSMKATYTYCSDDVATLPPISRQCYFEHEHSLGRFRLYRNSDCDHMCYVRAVYSACHCWLYYLPNIRSERVCKLTDIPCIIQVKMNMSEWLTEEQCDCPRDCVSRQYKADIIIGNFNALPYVNRNFYEGLTINKSTCAMQFYFGSPVYVKQKQETVTSIVNVVSNLGGVFGLFMGCSGISVLEVMFYLYLGIKDWLYCRVDKWRRNIIAHCTYHN